MTVFDAWSQVIPLVLAAGVAQGVFLTVVLLAVQRGLRSGRDMLAGLMLSLTLSILCQLLSLTGLYKVVLPLFLTISGMPFLIGPFLYLGLLRFTGSTNFRLSELLHFVPFLLNLLFLAALLFTSETELRTQLADPSAQEGVAWYPVLKTLALVWYGIASLLRLKRSAVRLRDQRSSFAKLNLLWLQNLLGGYLGLLAVLLLMQVFPALTERALVSSDSVMTLVMVGMIYGMGYFWMKHPILLAGDEVAALANPVRYKDSVLRPEQAELYQQKLVNLLASEEPFLDPELTLAQLASRLRVPPHHLSQVINERLGQNFYELINGYRIEKAKTLLRSSARSNTILDVAFEVGFNSKATFNRAFKKQVLMTPSAYQKEAL